MKCLLLNSTYDNMAFITEIRAIKLYFNDKIEVISSWDEKISWVNGSIKIPATVRLKNYVKYQQRRVAFSRIMVFKRDSFMCQYCSRQGTDHTLTIDHILPKSRGGQTTWLNTTTSCPKCNMYKNNQTPEEAGLKLLSQPYVPDLRLRTQLPNVGKIHEDWYIYLK